MSRPTLQPAADSRWIAGIAILAVIGLRLALPESLAVVPWWLHTSLLAALLVGSILTHRRHRPEVNQILGYILASVITFFLVSSLVLLVMDVPSHRESPGLMMRSAVALWTTNVLVFAYWYWRIDGGGPHDRNLDINDPSRGFLFPQLTVTNGEAASSAWSPTFLDYLFLSFNTSMAFSPTDAAVLSRVAKVLTMLQATISLTVVVVLAARAINIF